MNSAEEIDQRTAAIIQSINKVLCDRFVAANEARIAELVAQASALRALWQKMSDYLRDHAPPEIQRLVEPAAARIASNDPDRTTSSNN